jgi:hypothetical protein
MAYSEDHIALAAEYALGTLDAEERAQVESMMAMDKEFTALVQAWEFRLGPLNQMVGLVEPRPIVWENIRAAIGQSSTPQAPLALPPEAPSPPPPPVEPTVVTERAEVVDDGRVGRLFQHCELGLCVTHGGTLSEMTRAETQGQTTSA